MRVVPPSRALPLLLLIAGGSAGHPVVAGGAVETTEPVAPVENCLPRATVADRTAVLGGTTTDGASWVTAFGIDERGIQMVCVAITYEGSPALDGRIGGPFEPADDPGEIVVAVMNAGRAAGPRWYVVRGTVTADAVRVSLAIEDGAPLDVQLADAGPEPGWLWYALVVPHSGAHAPHVVATAYDEHDVPIATGEDLFHDDR
jgi:hypothetical protein